ncbi:MAG: hypothetical protein ACTHJM_05970 [Marmoricola sp.]
MRVVGHPAVLTMVLIGLLMWAWSIVDVVPEWQWLVWIAAFLGIAALVARVERSHKPRRTSRRIAGSR